MLDWIVSKKQTLRILGLLAAFLLPVIVQIQAASANNSSSFVDPLLENTDCAALDIIFLIDQSASMSEYGNDPLESRKYAVQTALDFMGDITLDSCPGVQHRVAVISYGSDAQVDLPLSEIGPYRPDQAGEAFNRRDELKRSVQATNLGMTDPLDAFVEANNIFTSMGSAVGEDDEIRKRAIIFITDGVPDVDPALTDCDISTADTYARCLRDYITTEFPFDPTLLNLEQCLGDLRAELEDPEQPLPPEKVTACLDQNRVSPDSFQNSTYIWMLLMRDSGRPYPGLVQEIFEEIAADHAGKLVNLTNNRQAVPGTFRDIMQQLTGVRAERIECGNFAVNPYLKRATLSFFKFDPENLVRVSYEAYSSGQEYVLESNESSPVGGFNLEESDYTVAGANERYSLAKPYPGIWNLASDDCEGLIADYKQIDMGVNTDGFAQVLPQFSTPPYFNPNSAKHILQFQLIDSDNGELVKMAEHPQFAIDASATVSGPGFDEVLNFTYYREADTVTIPVTGADGNSYDLTFSVEPHTFVADKPILTKEIGEYKIDLTARSNRYVGEVSRVPNDYGIFDQSYTLVESSHTLQVEPVSLFGFNILTPEAGQVFKPIHGPSVPGDTAPEVAELPIKIQVVDFDGNPSLTDEISRIFVAPNDSFVATISDPQNEEHLVTLSQDPANPDIFQGVLPNLGQQGNYELTIDLVGEVDETKFFPESTQKSATFERQDETWRFKILEPAENAVLEPIHDRFWDGGPHWPLHIYPIDIRAELVNEEGVPYENIQEVLNYAPQELHAVVTSGEEVLTLPLISDPQNPGQFIGTVEDLEATGDHQLKVDLALSYPDFTPESEPAFSSFQRSDNLLTTATTYFGLLAILLLLLLLFIIRYRAQRSNPIRGELLFMEHGSEIGRINLYNGKNKRKIGKKELDQYPQLELKSITANSMKKEKISSNGEEQFGDFGGVSGFGGDGTSIRVDYVTEEKERVRGEVLEPHKPVPCGDTIFTMQYQPIDEGN